MGGIVSCVLLNEIQITIVAIETLLFAASLFFVLMTSPK